ncbi:MAG: RNA 2',3'-cyclic phosphodiesterase [Burkholderiaceae bacterium]
MAERSRTAAPPPTARLFVALWPGARTRSALAAWRDACCWPPPAKPVPDAKLHLTLHFIGAVPRTRVAEIAQGLVMRCPAFELELAHVAAWPRGLVVLEPATVPDALHALHAGLADALRALDLRVERRRLRPHVTLARDAPGARWPAMHPSLRWRASGAALVESLPDGRYRVLSRLAAARAMRAGMIRV